MRTPTMVYRYPGKHKIECDFYDYKVVEADKANKEEQSELEKAIAGGWFLTTTEAKKSVDETSPPAREEMETKAKELNITFNKSTTNAALLKKIEEKLA
jgi:hypothetical protein